MPTCHEPCGGRFVASRGIASHRYAHLRRGETVLETIQAGTFRYTPRPCNYTEGESHCVKWAGHFDVHELGAVSSDPS